jgi:hypothetical protein
MNLESFRRILNLADNPQVALRPVDKQVAPEAQTPTPGLPQGPQQAPKQPSAPSPAALNRVADSILFPSGKPPSTQPAGRPEQETGMPSLSQHLRNRKASQLNEPTMGRPTMGKLTLGGM